MESDAFELHPVSGEIEYGEVGPVGYKRLDEETLQARVDIVDLGLTVIYLWCQGDQEGGGDGWRVSEVLPLIETTDISSGSWWPTIAAAERGAGNSSQARPPTQTDSTEPHLNGYPNGSDGAIPDSDSGDDDDYWAQYDKTPGRTPAPSRSPPRSDTSALNGHTRSTSEEAYFSQYAHVQPEMDNDDPSTQESTGPSSLHGNTFTDPTSRHPLEEPLLNGFPRPVPDEQRTTYLTQPSPRTPPTADSETVSRLEDSALMQSAGEAAVRQHVGTSIKSLFRLCRAVGIERGEFEEMVKTELETLSMLTEDD